MIQLIAKIFLICISILFLTIVSIIFYRNKNEYLSGLFDKIGTGAVGGLFVSWMINSSRIWTEPFFGKIHIISFGLTTIFLLWSIILKKEFKLNK